MREKLLYIILIYTSYILFYDIYGLAIELYGFDDFYKEVITIFISYKYIFYLVIWLSILFIT